MEGRIMKNAANCWLIALALVGFNSMLAGSAEERIAELKSPDPTVRIRAALALGKLGDTKAVEPLIACLKDQDSYVRRRAALALGKLGDARAIASLCAALPDWETKELIGSALVRLGWKPTTDFEQVYL
jgi:HEAT repeat protein